ncbi:hypothetical protein IWQ60_010098 [Tieghemiomyces parasiticus]|uniref:Uncharacterized protein n=1 Tax=Tieghemiomyces parasiticus TaxID=78921 RepID=A0A9W7ZVG7_9FUNG|nr:hypothetical protein IWQ60_010098 [Tieghemiomyces parasiticus]
MTTPENRRRPGPLARTASLLGRTRARSISAQQPSSAAQVTSAAANAIGPPNPSTQDPRSRTTRARTSSILRAGTATPVVSAVSRPTSLVGRPRNVSHQRGPTGAPETAATTVRRPALTLASRPVPPTQLGPMKTLRHTSAAAMRATKPITYAYHAREFPATDSGVDSAGSSSAASSRSSSPVLPSDLNDVTPIVLDTLDDDREQVEFLRREMYVAERAYGHLLGLANEAVRQNHTILTENLELRQRLMGAGVGLPAGLTDYQDLHLISAEDLINFPHDGPQNLSVPPPSGVDHLAATLAQLDPRPAGQATYVDKALSPRPEEPKRLPLTRRESRLPVPPRSLLPVSAHRLPSRTEVSSGLPRLNRMPSAPTLAQGAPASPPKAAAAPTKATFSCGTQTESYDMCHPDAIFNLEIDNDYYREANRQLRCRLTNITSKHNALVGLIQEERERRRRKREREERRLRLQQQYQQHAHPHHYLQQSRVASESASSTLTAADAVEAEAALTATNSVPSAKPSRYEPRRPSPVTSPAALKMLPPDPGSLSGLNTMVADIEYSMQQLALKISESPPRGSLLAHPTSATSPSALLPPPAYHLPATFGRKAGYRPNQRQYLSQHPPNDRQARGGELGLAGPPSPPLSLAAEKGVTHATAETVGHLPYA